MIQKYLDYLKYELNRSPHTIKAYRNDLDQFSVWLVPDNSSEPDFASVTSSDIRTWLNIRARKGDSSRSVRRKLISLRSFFKWMVTAHFISVSPIQNIPLPKLPKQLPEFIKPEEIEDSLIALKNSEKSLLSSMTSLIIEILFTTGIRRAELIGINDSDISFSKGDIRVLGKRSKQRIIPISQNLLAKIKNWQNIRDKSTRHISSKPSQDSPLFLYKGKRISPGQIYYIVNKSLQGTSARKKSPHALRHSFASSMLNGGADIDAVKEFLGHASLSTTQIYTHISLKEIKKAYTHAHPRANDEKN